MDNFSVCVGKENEIEIKKELHFPPLLVYFTLPLQIIWDLKLIVVNTKLWDLLLMANHLRRKNYSKYN